MLVRNAGHLEGRDHRPAPSHYRLSHGSGLQQLNRRSPGSADPAFGDRYLRVGDVDVCAFLTADAAAGDVTLKAKLLFKCLKGLGVDPASNKTCSSPCR
jgi:hypothetical protein